MMYLLIITILSSLCACGIKKTSSEISHTNFSVAESSIPSAIKQEIISATSTSNVDVVNSDYTPPGSCLPPTTIASVADFRDWLIEGRTSVLNGESLDLYESSKGIFIWSSQCDKVLVPKTVSEFKIYNIFTSSNEQTWYKVFISKTKNAYKENEIHKEMVLSFYPIAEAEDLEKSLLVLINDCVYKNINVSKSTVLCKWGEYYVDKTSPTAYFRYDDYVIECDLPYLEDGAQFDPAYFNYFDFEYVSLENY